MTPIAQIIDLARISHHALSASGATFSVPPSDNISTWNNNATYLRDREIGINLADEIVYMRIGGDIVQIYPVQESSISGTPSEVPYFDSTGHLTSDTLFTRTSAQSILAYQIFPNVVTGLVVPGGSGGTTGSQIIILNTSTGESAQVGAHYPGSGSGFESVLLRKTKIGLVSGYLVNQGGVQYQSPNGSTRFTFPSTDGSNGQVMTTNGSGQLSFTTVSGGTGSLPTGSDFQILSLNSLNQPMFNDILQDAAGVLSIDFWNRTINDSSGSDSVDYNNRLLYDNGVNVSLNWFIHTQYDASGIISIDWQNRQIKNGAGNTVIDYNGLSLIDGSNITAFNWNTRILYDESGATSIDLQNRKLSDSGGATAMAWGTGIGADIQLPVGAFNGYVLTSDGSGNATWQASGGGSLTGTPSEVLYFDGSGNVTGDALFTRTSQVTNIEYTFAPFTTGANIGQIISTTGSGLMITNNTTGEVGAIFAGESSGKISSGIIYQQGSTSSLLTANNKGISYHVNGNKFLFPVIEGPQGSVMTTNGTGNLTLQSVLSNGLTSSIDFFNRILFDSLGRESLDWLQRELVSSDSVQALNWDNRTLVDSSNRNTMAWNNRETIDSSNVTSIDWDNRYLIAPNNTIALDWITNGQVVVAEDLIVNGNAYINGTASINGSYYFNTTLQSGNTMSTVGGPSGLIAGGEGFEVIYTDVSSAVSFIEIGSNGISGTSSVTIGSINGSFSNYLQLSEQNVKIVANDNTYIWPTNSGAPNEVMTTDGVGNLYWSIKTLPYVYSTQSDAFVYVIIPNYTNVIDTTGGVITSCSMDVPNAPNDGDVFEIKVLGNNLAGVAWFGTPATLLYPPTTLLASNQVYKFIYDATLGFFV